MPSTDFAFDFDLNQWLVPSNGLYRIHCLKHWRAFHLLILFLQAVVQTLPGAPFRRSCYQDNERNSQNCLTFLIGCPMECNWFGSVQHLEDHSYIRLLAEEVEATGMGIRAHRTLALAVDCCFGNCSYFLELFSWTLDHLTCCLDYLDSENTETSYALHWDTSCIDFDSSLDQICACCPCGHCHCFELSSFLLPFSSLIINLNPSSVAG